MSKKIQKNSTAAGAPTHPPTREQILAHFAQGDLIMHRVLESFSWSVLPVVTDPHLLFHELCRSIIGQQLSIKVAAVIEARVFALFQNNPTPRALADTPGQVLRDQGVSWAKVRSLHDLAHKILTQQLDLGGLVTRTDEDVCQELQKVVGIGPWTAQMFLLFGMGRPSVFSPGDLGLQRGMAILYAQEHALTEDAVTALRKLWHPYQSYACRGLWHAATPH